MLLPNPLVLSTLVLRRHHVDRAGLSRFGGGGQAVEKVILILYEDGNVHYSNLVSPFPPRESRCLKQVPDVA